MKVGIYINCLMCLGLAGCSATYPSRASDPLYFFGSELAPEGEAGTVGSNGLPYAAGSQALADIEGGSISVKLARFVRNPMTRQTTIILSDETAILPEGFTSFEDAGLTISYDGEALTFINVASGDTVTGITTLESGQSIWSYMNYAMSNSGTGGIYSYEKFDAEIDGNPIDTEGFFAFGFQTDPSDIIALGGEATFNGSYFGYGQVLDLDGNILDEEFRTIGAITIEANFDGMQVSGQLNGLFDPDDIAESYTMVFIGASIEGNGFIAAPDMICGGGSSCTSASSLGAVFYGNDAAEISGVIGFDETISLPGPDDPTRFVGTAGFSSARDLD